MIRKIQWFAMAVTAVLCAACDAHIDVPDTAVRPGHILCEDGTALSYVQYEQSGKRAIAVVFDTEHREGTEGNGYAVYLWHRCGCCMPSGKPSILSSNGVAAIRCRWMKTTAGTGHRRR